MKKLLLFLVPILAVTFGVTAPRSQARIDVPAGVTARVAAGESVAVIVGVDATFVPEGRLGGPDAVSAQRDGIARVLADVMARASDAGVIVGSSFEILPFFSARVSRQALEALAAMPGVTSIEVNGLDRADLASSVPITNAPSAWSAGHTGTGWTVAVIDTGIEKTHGFLTGKVLSEACYVNAGGAGSGTSTCPGGAFASTAVGSGVPCSVASDCSHGTHVAGIAAGFNAPGGVNGVAPGASLAAMQVFTRFDDAGNCGGTPPCASAYVSDQVLALIRIAALAGAGNANRIAVANMSLGGGSFSDQATCDASNSSNGRKAAIDNLLSLGIAVAAASGNNGFRTSMSAPACISTAVSVGSITDAMLVSSFSNNAPFLSLYAPGSDVTSSVQGNTFASFNGTSMATPHVAGAWAILKQAVPAAGVATVAAALQATGASIADTRSGGGGPHPLININAARLALLGGGGGGAPGAPTGFAAGVNGNNVNMSWNAPPVTDAESIAGGPATGYTIVVRFAPGGPVVTSIPVGNVTALGVAAPNGAYTLSVVATNASGFSPESNAVSITVPALPAPPGNPTGLVANVVGNAATFTWTAPASGGPVGNYVLVAGQTPAFVTPLATLVLPASPASVGVAGIPPGTWYVRILATNAGGTSAPTNEVQVVVAGPMPPGAPTLNAAVVVGNTVNLSWSAGAGGAPTSYTLFAAVTPGGAPILSVPLTGNAIGFAGVPSGTYYLVLVANNALGSSLPSNQITVVVP